MKKNKRKAKIAELASSQGRQVFLTAYRLLGDSHLAEDVTQEVFIKLFKKSPEAFDAISNWPGYLKSMATSAAIDQIRRRQRQAEEPYDTVQSVYEQQNSKPQLEPYHQLARDRDLDNFRHQLTALSDQEAQVFCLRHINELSYQEIAGLMNISNSLVGVTLNRAQQKLSQLLGESQFLGANYAHE